MPKQAANYRYYSAILLILASVPISFAVATQLHKDQLAWFIMEGGIVEVLSAIGYLFCIAIILIGGGCRYLREHWYFIVLLAAFSAREFDLDKRFTAVGVFKSKFVLSPDVGLVAKMIGVSVVVVILIAVGKILWRYSRHCLVNVWKFKPLELAIGWAGAFLIIAKTIDGVGRKLAALGIPINETMIENLMYLEESLELAIPYLLCIAASFYFNSRPRKPISLSQKTTQYLPDQEMGVHPNKR